MRTVIAALVAVAATYYVAPAALAADVGRPIQPSGHCDQQKINQAIEALPPDGGSVRLAAGTFEICRGENPLGGIIIDKSNVTLSSAGASTILKLADGADANVIREVGAGTRNVTIRRLRCDGNRSNNDHRDFDHRFEVSCIRAGGTEEWQTNIVVDSVSAGECSSLCVMIFGRLSAVRDSLFGDANSDVVELLGEGNQIVNNRAVIRGVTGYVFGGDAQSDMLIADNTVIVERSGLVTEAIFRTYGGLRGTVLTGNTVRVEPGGWVAMVTDLRSYFNIIGRNNFNLRRREGDRALTKMKFNGGTVVTGNLLQSLAVVLDDSSKEKWGAIANDNILSDVEMPSLANASQ
jgi:hypothetical protein